MFGFHQCSKKFHDDGEYSENLAIYVPAVRKLCTGGQQHRVESQIAAYIQPIYGQNGESKASVAAHGTAFNPRCRAISEHPSILTFNQTQTSWHQITQIFACTRIRCIIICFVHFLQLSHLLFQQINFNVNVDGSPGPVQVPTVIDPSYEALAVPDSPSPSPSKNTDGTWDWNIPGKSKKEQVLMPNSNTAFSILNYFLK